MYGYIVDRRCKYIRLFLISRSSYKSNRSLQCSPLTVFVLALARSPILKKNAFEGMKAVDHGQIIANDSSHEIRMPKHFVRPTMEEQKGIEQW